MQICEICGVPPSSYCHFESTESLHGNKREKIDESSRIKKKKKESENGVTYGTGHYNGAHAHST
jgi:hypothetical protein